MNYWHYLERRPLSLQSGKCAEDRIANGPRSRCIAWPSLRYGIENWNAARIDAEIAQVDDWAKHWNVPVICNEFGVYRKYADPKARAAWITDVRTALEKHNIGWAMWDYSRNFGVVTRQTAHPTPDEANVRALGRTMPPRAKIIPAALPLIRRPRLCLRLSVSPR